MILWHYRSKMEVIWNEVWQNVNTKFKHPVWAYAVLPIVAVALEITGALPKILFYLVTEPAQVWAGVQGLINRIIG